MEKLKEKLLETSNVKELLKEYGLSPNKKFGQNFLLDKNVLNNIARSAAEDDNEVLEIGPGLGALTGALLPLCKKVVSVEIDNGMVEVLKSRLRDYDNFEIISGDILNEAVRNEALSKLNAPFTLCANLPYYITTPIIMCFLENDLDFESMVIMMQKEVARRICAKPGTKEYGILTLAIEYYAKSEILFEVSPNCFYPKPNVDSIVIKLKKRTEPLVTVSDTKLLFRCIKSGFAMRRKTIYNNLKSAFDLDKEVIEQILIDSEIEKSTRGETLNLQQYATLSENFYKILSKSIE